MLVVQDPLVRDVFVNGKAVHDIVYAGLYNHKRCVELFDTGRIVTSGIEVMLLQ